MMQWLDLTLSSLSSITMEVKGDESNSIMSLCNAIQIEVGLAVEFTQICLTIFIRTRIQAAILDPTAAPADIYSPSV
jgi:hypothetical protein